MKDEENEKEPKDDMLYDAYICPECDSKNIDFDAEMNHIANSVDW